MGIFEEKIKFEQLLIGSGINPLTVAYHGSTFSGKANDQSDIDVVLIVKQITPELFNKLNSIVGRVGVHMGISLVTTKEAGTIFGGSKYYDALHRSVGKEKGCPLAYFKIAFLNEQFKKFGIDLNFKKCTNIAKIIVKTINNYLDTDMSLNTKDWNTLVRSFEKNLNSFYGRVGTPGTYKEEVKIKNR